MIEINTKRSDTQSRLMWVGIKIDTVKVEDQLLNESEIDDLAEHLMKTIWNLAPNNQTDAYEWLHKLMQSAGIDISRLVAENDE